MPITLRCDSSFPKRARVVIDPHCTRSDVQSDSSVNGPSQRSTSIEWCWKSDHRQKTSKLRSRGQLLEQHAISGAKLSDIQRRASRVHRHSSLLLDCGAVQESQQVAQVTLVQSGPSRSEERRAGEE